jgi:thioester reductase-like protein
LKSVIDYLERWAAIQPDRCLFAFLNIHGNPIDSYTYRRFHERTRGLADYLSRQHGLQHGDRVLLAYPAGLELIAAFFACARIGLIPVPVCPPTAMNRGFGGERLSIMAADCQARAVLSTRKSCDRVRWSVASHRTGAFANGTSEQPRLELIGTDDAVAEASQGFRNSPNEVLFLQYTSGSTGDPHGVVVSHENVVHNARNTIDHTPIGVSWLPQYHDMGLIGYYLFPVITGGTTYGFSSFDFLKRPALWLQIISRVRATYASSPNFGFDYCLRPGKITPEELRGTDLGSLRVLMNAADSVRVDTYQDFYDRFSHYGLKAEAHVVAYGLAENTLAATHYGRRIAVLDKNLLRENVACSRNAEQAHDDHARIASCGRPPDGIRVRVVDPEARAILPDGNIGEVWIAGGSVCRGYWGNPDLTRETFCNHVVGDPQDAHSYLRTGDLGFFDGGELFVCGRIKELIILRGVNYYPQDIEAIVESMSPKIRRGCVAAFSGDEDGQTLAVVAEVGNVSDLVDPAEIARVIRTRCHIEPSAVLIVPPRTIDKTTSGKTARRMTRERFLNGTLPVLRTHRTLASSASREEMVDLKARFAYIFALCAVAECDTLTLGELGIDSLTLAQLLVDLERVLDEHGASDLIDDIDATLLQKLTVTDFSRVLDQLADGSDHAIAACGADLRRIRGELESEICAQMRVDSTLSQFDQRLIEMKDESAANVLLTGATGFLGPFLLESLLRRTPYTYYALTRACSVSQGLERIRDGLRHAKLWTPSLDAQLHARVRVVCGNLAQDDLGLAPGEWMSLASRIHVVFHSAAMVNYVLNYDVLKPHNVEGTRTLLRLAHSRRRKEFHFISSTFIFGWTAKGLLVETDNNDEMMSLDFGYAQTKWVAEQLVFAAARQGLKVRVYRPALISASRTCVGDRNDVAIRLLSFMINHGIAVDTNNQVSILPADVAADNIAAIFNDRDATRRTFHVTVDDYYKMTDLTQLITRKYGYPFTYYDIPDFIAEINRRCTKEDPLYPLLDFFNRSASKIAAMQLKRYRNDEYRSARKRSGMGCGAPALKDTVAYMMSYMLNKGLIRPSAVPKEHMTMSD